MASVASVPSARKNTIVCWGALRAMTRAMLLASVHGPLSESPIHTFAENRFASWVSMIDGRAWNPCSCVSTVDPVARGAPSS